jgi:hypothetical protein
MIGLALVHVNRSCRLSICMAESNTKCISWLTFFLSSKINADQMKITMTFRSIMTDSPNFLRDGDDITNAPKAIVTPTCND